MESNTPIKDDAQRLYTQLEKFLNNFDGDHLQKNNFFINKQEETPKKLAWTRFSNSSDPLPPIRHN